MIWPTSHLKTQLVRYAEESHMLSDDKAFCENQRALCQSGLDLCGDPQGK